jgi:hypothetical protein
MTAKFQEFRIIGFALYTMTHAPACYQDVDDVLDLSYMPNTSENIDVNVLIPIVAGARQPFYASHPARCASFFANRRH